MGYYYNGYCGAGYYNYRTIEILRRLAPGSTVRVWFDNSGFITTTFQFIRDDEVAFSGGGFDGGLTYVKASDIRAIRIG
ncbi:hypothetical protein [Alicyclobacillus dauci]|uniref:Beta/Gamma crystallin n=1 Tax=Alicyclobacillus dauci TaxID=1475485 RepID=A0ABY6Z776_9BACL|nr:hypothetical protein [Alicyclobacillus dauci]WAH38452.1 hypothetical protein NZD86_08220 [Alicyclobacillus dauci]